MAVTIAKAKLGADKYPYVEPNHLSAPRDGRVYAQLPAANDIKVLTNGTFVKYDYAHGEVNFTGEGPWMMVFNEEKLYDERKQSHADFAMKKDEQVRGVMVPRVFGMPAVLGNLAFRRDRRFTGWIVWTLRIPGNRFCRSSWFWCALRFTNHSKHD